MSGADPTPSRRTLAPVALAATLLLFISIRAALAFARNPFFDELFTVWISRRPAGAILAALRNDSGPPLYYLLVHSVFSFSGPALGAARAVSLGAAVSALVAVAAARWLGAERWIAALLLSVLPVHVYFSTEARSYALCGTLTGIAVLLLDRWSEDGRRILLAGAAAALVLAAYSHYYGVLLFPIPLLAGLLAARSRSRAALEGAMASIACGLLFIPGFRLASIQPAGSAMRWMAAGRHGGIPDLLASFWRLGVAGPFPAEFLQPPPRWMQLGSLLLIAGLLAVRTLGSRRTLLFAISVLVPIAAVIAMHLAGRPVYFPLRFESVLAVPFALWLGSAVERSGRWVRPAALSLLVAAGAAAAIVAIVGASDRPPDPYAAAAQVARSRLDPRRPVIVTGFAFLAVESRVDEAWSPPIVALPAEQAAHPGWRAQAGAQTLAGQIDAIDRRTGGTFAIVAEIGSPELAAIASHHVVRVIFRADPVIVGSATRW